MENQTWSHEQLHTITFRFPKEFRRAVANSLGRIGDRATIMEVEEYLREVVKVNVEALMEDHLQRKSRMTVKRTCRSTNSTDRSESTVSNKKPNGSLKARVRRR